MNIIKKQMLVEGLINEALKSSILKSIMNAKYSKENISSSLLKDMFVKLNQIPWDEIKDRDILKLSPQNAKHLYDNDNNYLLFWMKLYPSELFAVTIGKNFFRKGSDLIKIWNKEWNEKRWGKVGSTSKPIFGIKEMMRECHIVYGIDLREYTELEKKKIRQENPPYKFDLEKVKQERKNKAELRKILYTPELANADMDIAIKKIFKVTEDIYQKPKFDDNNELIKTVTYGVTRNIGDVLNILMSNYADYINDWKIFQETKNKNITGNELQNKIDNLKTSAKRLQQVLEVIKNK